MSGDRTCSWCGGVGVIKVVVGVVVLVWWRWSVV